MTPADVLQAIPEHLTSPGAAFSFQAHREERLNFLMEEATVDLMIDIREMALKRELTSADAREGWRIAVTSAVAAFGLDPESEQGKYLIQGLRSSELGDEAYSSAMAVMRAAAETYPAPSEKDLRKALDEALSIETPSLVASVRAIFRRLRKLGAPWQVRVRRTVRTGFTGLMGLMTLGALRSGGFTKKRWVARHDEKTRHSHMRADGQTRDIDSPFLVGGAPLMYPGDRMGPIQETANCRCLIVGVK